MNKNLLLGFIVLLVVGVGYFFFTNSSSTPPTTPTPTGEEMTSPAMSEFTITLADQNDSGESGTAVLVEEDGKVKVTLSLTGAPVGVTQPAHIHVGACPDVGAVKYPLTSPVDGVSETVLNVTLDQLRSELPLGLNVHKSVAESSVYVSCGNLAL
jgi:hypothetical protein